MTPAEIEAYVKKLNDRGIEAKVVLTTCGPVAAPGGLDVVPKKRSRSPDPRTGGRHHWWLVLVPSCRVVSEANRRVEHWAARQRRFKRQAEAVADVWYASPINLPTSAFGVEMAAVITMTHVGPKMDDDNLAGAFKGIRDKVAELLGVDDGDGQVTWKYDQRPGKPGVEIRIEPRRSS